eukprot:gnl/MRDRNA2_/MRDRNA2_81347_c0_seq2.p3 gnl/MRDRNA2_/MRDRNA2_81347_c0~~gnl/MRDRNA2_/MRDRNA2_81347_c0_seq2.p3  ORF type:complete len:128 (+),score=14.25 gnl/MRDRNA2_/MRDRNA2_81347_c0_seq2:832-1215(+)
MVKSAAGDGGSSEIQNSMFAFLHILPHARPSLAGPCRQSSLCMRGPMLHDHVTTEGTQSGDLLWLPWSMWAGVPGTLWSLWSAACLDLARHLFAAWAVLKVPSMRWGQAIYHMDLAWRRCVADAHSA